MKSSFTRDDAELAGVLSGGGEGLVDADVPRLARAAVARSVEGAFLARLDALGVGSGSLRAALEDGRDACVARNTWLLRAARELSGRLTERGIDHRLVKGAALFPFLGGPGDRWMDDVDFLFREVDRAAVGRGLTELGLRHRPRTRHDGRASDPARGPGSVGAYGADGAPVDLHFTRRPLPVAAQGTCAQAPDDLAVALSDHVLRHHRPDARLLVRHASDLATLLEAGHADLLLAASERSEPLRLSLAWLASMGAPALTSRALPASWPRVTGPPALTRSARVRGVAMAARLVALVQDAPLLRLVAPSRAYLEAHDRAGRGRPVLELHARRFRRILASMRP